MDAAKVPTAKGRIIDFVSELGHNKVYAAFSGGKDSRAVLSLVRSIYPNIIVIHNEHAGEDPGDELGVLTIKGPKKEKVPQVMPFLDLVGQIDGTRKDEDDYVMVDGVDIHRSKMNSWRSSGGVWGMEVCFPIWDWTEEDVYTYLGQIGHEN